DGFRRPPHARDRARVPGGDPYTRRRRVGDDQRGRRRDRRRRSVTQQFPTLADVLEARRRISPHLRETPLFAYPRLDELLGTEVLVKHENHQPTGAFKVRGGVNLISQLRPEERERGVITASTGNHGQSIAYAA